MAEDGAKLQAASAVQAAGWTTVGKQQGRKATSVRPATREWHEGRQARRELKVEDAKHGGGKRMQAKIEGRNDEDPNSRRAGDGRMAYEQLRTYLRNCGGALGDFAECMEKRNVSHLISDRNHSELTQSSQDGAIILRRRNHSDPDRRNPDRRVQSFR